ncbi:hypothetical protein [Sinosporangium album]|uniref:hypothetical protein n=1 Tax=Sinosporangium album TaxID=504805 RepID=UPI0015A40E74|nr:hypothetical protein [Sinosporangium album]
MAADDRLRTSTAPRGLSEAPGPDELARRLRDAHRRVRALALPPVDKERIARRFVAICDLAKRDLGHAAARLDLLLADLAAASAVPSRAPETPSPPRPRPVSDTPRERNITQGD